MRKIALMVALCLTVARVNAQNNEQDSFRSKHLYNAYAVSKEMIKWERKLAAMHKDSTLNPKVKDSIRTMLGALLWYADVQDAEFGLETTELVKILKLYPRLESLYKRLSGKLYVLSFLNENDFNGVERYFTNNLKPANLTLFVNVKGELTKLLDPYFKLKDTIKDKEANKLTIAAAIDQVWNDSSAIAKRINDSVNVLRQGIGSASLINSIKEDSLSIAGKSEQLKKLRDSLNKLQSAITSHINAVETEKNKLIAHFTDSKQLNDKIIELLAASAGINTTAYAKEIAGPEMQLDISQHNYSQVKSEQATIVEQASLSFRLPSEAEMIDAIAIYLAKRVKQEAVMWFFETIRKNSNQYELLRTFFPNTITLLQSNEVYEIPNLGSQWRYALSKDFVKMPRSVLTSDWFMNWYNKKTNADRNLYSYLLAAFDACDLLNQQYNYSQFVKQMYLNLNNRNLPSDNNTITPANIFSILYAFNQECYIPVYKKDSVAETRLMRYEDFRNLTRDELEIMISLMDMKYSKAFAPVWRKITGDRFLADAKDGEAFRRWAGTIETGIEQFNKLQADYVKLTNEIKEGKKIDGAYTAFNIWDNINGLFNLVIPDTGVDNSKLKRIAAQSAELKKNAAMAFEIYHQLSLKNYTGAVNSTIALVEKLLYNDSGSISVNKAVVEDLLNKAREYKRETGLDTLKIISFNQHTIVSSLIFEKDRHAINLVRKLAGFLNDVMLTTNSKDLSKVVESYALPPGSYKRKRNSWWSIDLNAYVGGYYGLERLEGEENSWGGVYGITAPIGISFSKTFGTKMCTTDTLSEDMIRNPDKLRVGRKNVWKRGSSTLTFAVTAVDLGAVVSYRFSNTTEKGLPQEVEWAQVLSPGVRVAYGIPSTPLVLNLGYQYTPKLRQLNENGGMQHSTHRLQIGILFDLPLVNIWQRSYWRGYNTK